MHAIYDNASYNVKHNFPSKINVKIMKLSLVKLRFWQKKQVYHFAIKTLKLS